MSENEKNGSVELSQPFATDEEIIALYFDRDELAIRCTDDKYGRYLLTVAYNIIHSHEDSEECLDDTYLNTWNTIPPERPSFLRVFLSRIMRNVAINRYNEAAAAKRIPSHLMDSMSELDECMIYDPRVDEDTAIRELAAIISDFLETKTKRQRAIFLCRYYYGDPIARIAAMLEISERTVHRELVELRHDLRERLLQENYSV